MTELLWWEAYYQLEPSLDQRIDWLIASVREMIHNVAVDKKNRRPVKDFMLKFDVPDDRPQKPDWQRQRDMMLMIVEAQNYFVNSGQREL